MLGPIFPHLFTAMTKWMLRRATSGVILPGEAKPLEKHLMQRRKNGIRINLNRLGEAILGEKEAFKRLNLYLQDLESPAIDYISVKISTLFSQINLLGFESTLKILSERLKILLRVANNHLFKQKNGHFIPKFVNLDMEEYKDLHLTVALFKHVLDDPEFFSTSAGIVLQSYLPDSYQIQTELTEWAMQRVASGGAPIKIRLVKGANLAMEKVEASIKSWPQATYLQKIEVDANFKRMIDYGCIPIHAEAAHIGIGSHNLFDIAYGMIVRAECQVSDHVGFEMLEGMADHVRRVVQNLSKNMLLYCPAAKREEFQNAIAYLIRRLDENTGSENFLRQSFNLKPGTKEWKTQAEQFKHSCAIIDQLGTASRKTQNRFVIPAPAASNAGFVNEPDTDWSLPINQQWAKNIIETWSQKTHEQISNVIDGVDVHSEGFLGIRIDLSNPAKPLYHYALATEEDIEKAIKTACEAKNAWKHTSIDERSGILEKIAAGLRKERQNLLGAMAADGGKTLNEGDAEVSEAIDFAEYYRRKGQELLNMTTICWSPKGTVLVAPPWNFPCSIPAGGILAALIAGNTVIFKPAPEAILVGKHLAQIFWEAGVPKNVLQFVCCDDEIAGAKLIKDSRIDCVILTGATSTAKHLLSLRPDLDLIAETGGKNTIIVTDMADRELAIKDILQSAFGHSGQKCSACSLLICEGPVYDDPHFLRQLKDAAASLFVGSPWNLQSKITPLIRPPEGNLKKSISTLDSGEEWLLEPKEDPNNSHLWSPGIKLGVKEGSFMHQNELFGPVLGVMRAHDLHHAIQLANGTPYGLTAGLHSLDEREHTVWKEKIKAGNCYINRGITGAVVQRQPFGGWKESSFGPGAKAGGPHYLLQLLKRQEISIASEKEELSSQVLSLKNILHPIPSKDLSILEASFGSYAYWWNRMKRPQDPSLLLGQDNFFQLVPRDNLIFRAQKGIKILDLFRVCGAVLTCGARMQVSWSKEVFMEEHDQASIQKASIIFPSLQFIEENETTFLQRIRESKKMHIRLAAPPSKELIEAASVGACYLASEPIITDGRFELLHYTNEWSLSFDYHRYGNLILREGEKRAALPNGITHERYSQSSTTNCSNSS
jgi:RHH-type proline utilization regulon transcriptional repressor/proline dehydrogenase/delta 1-pyrroline-5-carboxylate dehydrogenase